MGQSLASVIIHLTFSTRDRYPFLDQEVCQELHRYLASILKDNDSTPIEIGGAADHVHVLFYLSKTHTLSHIVEKLKTGSSKWIKTKGGMYSKFYWQSGYGAFSVSQSNLLKVKTYIAAQGEHHQRLSFQDEFRAFLKKHQVPYDERYIWD